MTGFAARHGEGLGQSWAWDVRSVNGKGLDLRVRLPDGIEGLEPAVRAAVPRFALRGNVGVGLKLAGVEAGAIPTIHPGALNAAVAALKRAEDAALAADLSVSPVSPAEILSLRGVLESGGAIDDTEPLLAALVADLDLCLTDFAAARAAEGRALAAIIGGQIDRINALTHEAATLAEARRPAQRAQLLEAIARVTGTAVDEDRLTQELAMLAVKSDVTEEIDRMAAHVEAARALLTQGGAVGRRFDFLIQEFMREANTLCSKSGDAGLTRVGIELKTVIDQMREQVQNVE